MKKEDAIQGTRKFILLCDGYPKASELLRTEDFFAYPCDIAREMGLEPEIWTLRRRGWPERDTVKGIPVWRAPGTYATYRALRKARPALIHAYLRPHAPSLIAGLTPFPKVYTTVSYELGSNALVAAVSKALLRRFDRIIALTPYERGVYLEAGMRKDQMVRLPFAVDRAYFAKIPASKTALRKKWKVSSSHLVVITVANFRDCKRLDTMVRAFDRFTRNHPESTFLVIGQDRLQDAHIYKEQTKSAQDVERIVKRNKKIRWLGHRHYSEIRELLHAADVYVLSSSIEAQGLTNYEAASAGKAICLSTLGTFTSVFGEVALFHDPYDHAALAKNLALYADDEGLRKKNGEAAAKMMKAWEPAKIRGKLKELYREVLKKTL